MKCEFCFNKLSETDTVCEVCGIRAGKDKKELTKEEKKRRYFCLAIQISGLLTLFNSALWFATGVVFLANVLPRHGFNIIDIVMTALFFLAAVFLWMLGTALRRYERWTYYGAIGTFSIFIIFGITMMRPATGIIPLLLLYYVANRESRAILLRKNPPESSEVK